MSNQLFWLNIAVIGVLFPLVLSTHGATDYDAVSEVVSLVEEWQAEFSMNSLQDSGRPFVTVSYAQSLDGKLAPFSDDSNHATQSNYAISCPESLLLTHAIRSVHDGILIGGTTLGVDNPRLTNRLWGYHQPRPVVLDTSLRHIMELGVNMRLKNPIVCHDEKLELGGNWRPPIKMDLLPCKTTKAGSLDVCDVLRQLKRVCGLTSVMVEGGPTVIASFMDQMLVDAVCVTISPHLLGPGVGVELRKGFRVALETVQYISLGYDYCLLGRSSSSHPRV